MNKENYFHLLRSNKLEDAVNYYTTFLDVLSKLYVKVPKVYTMPF